MRVLALILVVCSLALQYPLWFGKGGWLKVRDLDVQVQAQKTLNAELKARNESLNAEVLDLKQGYAAIEERARADLGMIKQDEVFFQIVHKATAGASSSSKQ